MSRYRRLIPATIRRLLQVQRMSRPNWYVGSAEGAHMGDRVMLDQDFYREVEALKAAIDQRAARKAAQG